MQPTSFDDERTTATDITLQACGLAAAVQRGLKPSTDAVTKDDRSPVTVADLAIQAVVSLHLKRRYPADSLLAEESSGILESEPELAERVLDLVQRCVPGTDADTMIRAMDRGDATSSDRGRTWVLDPIDGTKGFLRGDQYAVALALVVDGEVTVGVLGCPNLPAAPGGTGGSLFAACRGAGATVRSLTDSVTHRVRVDARTDPTAARLCESVEAAHSDHEVQARIAQRIGITAPSVRIDSQCKYGVVARGDASVYLRLPRREDYREKSWDHAAGAIVVEEAGGRVSDLEGRSLDFSCGRLLGAHRGIVVTNGVLHDRVLEAAAAVTAEK